MVGETDMSMFFRDAPETQLENGADGLPNFQMPITAAAVDENLWCDAFEPSIAHLSDDKRTLVRKYYPLAWNKPTPYFDNGAGVQLHVANLVMLLEHAEQTEKAIARHNRTAAKEAAATRKASKPEQAAERTANAEAWENWKEQCRQRKAWIAGKVTAWHNAVKAREELLVAANAAIAAARADMESAKSYPAPAKPNSAQ